jgi:hypothetical protein
MIEMCVVPKLGVFQETRGRPMYIDRIWQPSGPRRKPLQLSFGKYGAFNSGDELRQWTDIDTNSLST